MDNTYNSGNGVNNTVGWLDGDSSHPINRTYTNIDTINAYGPMPINTWKTNLVSRMSNLFYNESSFNEDISNWDVSNVTVMNGMFRSSFLQPTS